MTGRVVHFEIPYDDEERAKAFYQRAFGWGLQTMPGMAYTMVSTGPADDQGMPSEAGFIGGGMFKRDGGPVSKPVVVIEVDSIDDSLETVAELGGRTLVEKLPVGDMGFSAYLQDPEGNVIGVWESAGS